jgi:hypothetical protein
VRKVSQKKQSRLYRKQMKKKEDLKKHSSEDKTGLITGHCRSSIVLFFLLFYDLSYSQIPLDGFCKLENYSVPLGYTGMITSDLDLDGNDELILYSNTTRQIGIFFPSTDTDTTFIEFKTSAEISRLKQIKESDSFLFAAVERKIRKISYLYLTADSLFENKGEITFDSFPENVYPGDIDLDGNDEVLVSGSGFDGLSLLYRAGNNIGERKIISGTSFIEAILIDLNTDGYPDILAFNILEGTLQFFYNNTNGDFSLERSLSYPIKLHLLKTGDLNEDGFDDIIYLSGTSLEILFGDFQSSYEVKTSVQLKAGPEGIQFGSFNNDNSIDFAYLNSNDGTINLRFGKPDFEFYERITYVQRPFAKSFVKFNYNKSDAIAVLSEDGELSFISKLKSFNSGVKIIPAIEPDEINKFDLGNDGGTDISFIDHNDNSLNLFITNNLSVPSAYYSFPLLEDHREIITDEFYKQRKTFYCYTKGKPLIEVLRYNFKTNKLSRRQLYAPGNIFDLTLQRVDSSLVNVFILYNKQSKLFLGKFENKDMSVTFKEYPFIDRNVTLAELQINNNPKAYYWKSEGDFNYFDMAEIKTGPYIYKNFFQVRKSDSLSIYLYGANKADNEYPSVVSLVRKETSNYALVITNNRINVLSESGYGNPNGSKFFSQGHFSETSETGIINFTAYSVDDDYVKRLSISGNGKNYNFIKMLAAENVSDYFIARLTQNKYYLVYSNKKEGFISISSVKK